ncbi:MAG: hypothetical protein PVI99_09465 [Anaerolineales bacterium]|jgi:hypothetical protein
MKIVKSAIIALFGAVVLLATWTPAARASSLAVPALGRGLDDSGGLSRTETEEKIVKIVDAISRITQVFIYLIGVFFAVRMMLLIFSSQISLAGGKPGAIADMASEMVYALLSFLIAVDMPKLAEAISSIAMKNADGATGVDIAAMGDVVEPIAGFVISLLGTLVFVGFIVNFVYTGVQAVVSSALGSPGGISNAISTGLSLIFTLLLGLGFLRAGQWFFRNNFQF